MNPFKFVAVYALVFYDILFGKRYVDDPWAPVADPEAAVARLNGPPEWNAAVRPLHPWLLEAIRAWVPPHVTVVDHGWRVVAHTPFAAVVWCNSYAPWEHELGVDLHWRTPDGKPRRVANLYMAASLRGIPYDDRIRGMDQPALADALQRSFDAIEAAAPGVFDDPGVLPAIAEAYAAQRAARDTTRAGA